MQIKRILEDLHPIAVLEYDAGITINKYRRALTHAIMTDRSPEIRGIKRELSKADQTDKESDEWLRFALEYMEAADPTTNKEYMIWLVKTYSAGGWGCNMEDILSEVKATLAKFHALKLHQKLKPNEKDILKYKTFLDLSHAMDNYADPEEKAQTERGQYKEVWNDDQVRIIRPDDKTAAIYFGQGTKWCTAATKGNNYFDAYSKDGSLYILLPKKPNYSGEKYQLHFESRQYMNPGDEPIYLAWLINERFNLLPWIRETDSYTAEEIKFYDVAEVSKVISGVREAIHEYLGTQVNNIDPIEFRQMLAEVSITDQGYIEYAEMDEEYGGSPATMTEIPNVFATRLMHVNVNPVYDKVANWILGNIAVEWVDDHYEVQVGQKWYNKL